MSKTEDEKLAKLIKKNMAKAAKAKPKARKRYDPTLPPDTTVYSPPAESPKKP